MIPAVPGVSRRRKPSPSALTRALFGARVGMGEGEGVMVLGGVAVSLGIKSCEAVTLGKTKVAEAPSCTTWVAAGCAVGKGVAVGKFWRGNGVGVGGGVKTTRVTTG